MKVLWENMKEKFEGYFLDQTIQNGNEVVISLAQKWVREIVEFFNQESSLKLVSMFASQEEDSSGLHDFIYYVFAQREQGFFVLLKALLPQREKRFYSVSGILPIAYYYEREIRDLFGFEPIEHQAPNPMVFHENWPRDSHPLLKSYPKEFKPRFVREKSDFSKVKGEGVFEVPVGPVHAGIIEPGHFRFSVDGEYIIQLEARLYFVHKGIEKMCEGMDIEKCFYVSERISGDETFSNSLAFCQAVERIANVTVPERARFTRVLFAELERVTAHLGDLAGICVDVAYGFAAFQFRLMRGWAYLLADELCGQRFLRSVNQPGGIRKDFVAGKEKKVLEQVNKIRAELSETVQIIKSNGMFLDRLEHTGILKTKVARELNATGPAGRASGIRYDVRKAFPYAAYNNIDFKVPEHNNGDVNCRMNVKIEEVFASLDIISQCLEKMWEGAISVEIGDLPSYQSAVGFTESPRGENIHWLMTGERNTVYRYKIRTPSFCNWPALCQAVCGNILPDFPLINKSFNLSYAGNDL